MKHTSSRYEYVVYVKKYNYKTNVNSLHRVYLSRACKNESCKLREKIEWFKILAYINSQEILYLIVQLFVTTKKATAPTLSL